MKKNILHLAVALLPCALILLGCEKSKTGADDPGQITPEAPEFVGCWQLITCEYYMGDVSALELGKQFIGDHFDYKLQINAVRFTSSQVPLVPYRIEGDKLLPDFHKAYTSFESMVKDYSLTFDAAGNLVATSIMHSTNSNMIAGYEFQYDKIVETYTRTDEPVLNIDDIIDEEYGSAIFDYSLDGKLVASADGEKMDEVGVKLTTISFDKESVHINGTSYPYSMKDGMAVVDIAAAGLSDEFTSFYFKANLLGFIEQHQVRKSPYQFEPLKITYNYNITYFAPMRMDED